MAVCSFPKLAHPQQPQVSHCWTGRRKYAASPEGGPGGRGRRGMRSCVLRDGARQGGAENHDHRGWASLTHTAARSRRRAMARHTHWQTEPLGDNDSLPTVSEVTQGGDTTFRASVVTVIPPESHSPLQVPAAPARVEFSNAPSPRGLNTHLSPQSRPARRCVRAVPVSLAACVKCTERSR